LGIRIISLDFFETAAVRPAKRTKFKVSVSSKIFFIFSPPQKLEKKKLYYSHSHGSL
jgi:hypothetical protein